MNKLVSSPEEKDILKGGTYLRAGTIVYFVILGGFSCSARVWTQYWG